MIRITADEYKTVPWKNGKGVTQLIISSTDNDNYDWRFSRADVSVDGPFSIFEGKSRILTVIEGAGLSLISNSCVIHAKPNEPVSFSGDIKISGKLWQGPIKDLNLIYSSKRIKAQAQLIEDNNTIQLKPDDKTFYAVYCIKGQIDTDSNISLYPGEFGVINATPNCISQIENSQTLFYTIKKIS